MKIEIDADVHAAAAMLQQAFPAAKLVGIVEALADVAPALWGRYGRESVAPTALMLSSSLAEQTPAIA